MGVEFTTEAGGRILVLTLTGKLTRADYEEFVPAVGAAVRAHGRVRMLVRTTDFHGWTTSAPWEDVKFDVRHFADIERVALVGDRSWQAGMAVFCKPFTRARVRYFNMRDAGPAAAWVREGMEQAAAAIP